MIKGITLLLMLTVACTLMSCRTTSYSHSLIIESKINSKYVIGKDHNNMWKGRCLWYMDFESKPDTTVCWERNTWHILIFENPTEVKYDSTFIIVKRELPHRAVRFLIVKYRFDLGRQLYYARNKKIYNRLRKKLGVADSLKFE